MKFVAGRVTRCVVVGKMAPYHNGHHELVTYGLAHYDLVHVLIYNSREFDEEWPSLNKGLRSRAITNSFLGLRDSPRLSVYIGHNPPPDLYTPVGNVMHGAYVQGKVDYKIDAIIGSEDYICDMSEVMGAEPIFIGRDDKLSATLIRERGVKNSKHLMPEGSYNVWKDII